MLQKVYSWPGDSFDNEDAEERLVICAFGMNIFWRFGGDVFNKYVTQKKLTPYTYNRHISRGMQKSKLV